jgi:protein import protein ZIM17
MPPINSFSSTARAFSWLSYTSPRAIRSISGPRLLRQPQCAQQRRLFSSSFNLFSPPSSGSPKEPQKSRLVEQPENPQPQSPKRDQPSYDITFTCTPCSARSTHRITKHAYHHGSILITCPSCRNRHIISDHLKVS